MIVLLHEQAQELLGAFALDALEADEAEAVELHLFDCARCRAEVSEYRETAAMLAFGGVEAPAGVWEKIAASLEEAPPALRLAPVVEMRPPSFWRVAGVRLVVAAAVVISLLALGVSVQSRGRSGSSNDREIAAWSLDPATRHVHLVASDGSMSAEVLLRNGSGMLAKHSLPRLPEGETYQLWGQQGEMKVSLGVLGQAPKLGRFPVGAKFQALAITAEKAPGVVTSSNAAVVVGWVPTA